MPAVVLGSSESQMIVNGQDIKSLTNDEIYQRLVDLGAQIGPVEKSTRFLYEKKLYRLLTGEVPDKDGIIDNGSNNESRFSESEGEETAPPSARRRTQAKPDVDEQNDSATVIPPYTPIDPLASTSHIQNATCTPSLEERAWSPYNSLTRRPLHSGGTIRTYSLQDSPSSLYIRPGRSEVAMTNGDGKAEVHPNKKNSSWLVTCFEVAVFIFLAVVGYIFYSEIRAYSEAEREFIESNAQNVED